jgi:hypothetical protein
MASTRYSLIALAIIAATALCSCDKDSATSPTTTPANKQAACLGFNVTTVSGRDSGVTYDGDLIMTIEPSGYFTGALMPADPANQALLSIGDSTRIKARVTGQVNGVQVSWLLYIGDSTRIFGSGMIDLNANPQTLRGSTSGPERNDIGIFHGRWFPPYIRTVS